MYCVTTTPTLISKCKIIVSLNTFKSVICLFRASNETTIYFFLTSCLFYIGWCMVTYFIVFEVSQQVRVEMHHAWQPHLSAITYIKHGFTAGSMHIVPTRLTSDIWFQVVVVLLGSVTKSIYTDIEFFHVVRQLLDN